MTRHTETAEHKDGLVYFRKPNKQPDQTQIAGRLLHGEKVPFDQRSLVFDPHEFEPLKFGEALSLIAYKQVDAHSHHRKIFDDGRSIEQHLVVGCCDNEIT